MQIANTTKNIKSLEDHLRHVHGDMVDGNFIYPPPHPT